MDIRISVRVRPMLSKGEESAVHVSGPRSVSVGSSVYNYPASVVSGSDQVLAFSHIAGHMMGHLAKGYSCTLIAYGQTGSGKTYTMFGPTGCLTEFALKDAENIPAQWGIIPRFVMKLMTENKGLELQASAVEVYQEVAYDLLNSRAQLRVGKKQNEGNRVGQGHVSMTINGGARDTSNGIHPACCWCRLCFKATEEAKKKKGKRDKLPRLPKTNNITTTSHLKQPKAKANTFQTVGETLLPLKTPGDIARMARLIEATRSAKSHDLNDRSSRSHCLVKVSWMHKKRQLQMLFVDLAGSERVLKSKVEGQRLAEAAKINNSLLALGKVIQRLAKKEKHVPFRDSTLTMLLRSSLGGRVCTSVVVNIASEQQHADETNCTLRFGSRVSFVKNKAKVNKIVDVTKEQENVEDELAFRRRELEMMERAGEHGGLIVSDTNAAERLLLQENLKKLRVMERDLKKTTAALTEAKGAGKPVAALESKLKQIRNAIGNHGDVVARQKSIKTLWAEPSKNYKAKDAEVRELEAKLRMLKN